VRHGRMVVPPFTFYRGAAKVMAADLTATPTAALDAQLCGDAICRTSATDSPARYADQNDEDFRQFVQAGRTGRLQAVEGV
jgi:hypothetical protein